MQHRTLRRALAGAAMATVAIATVVVTAQPAQAATAAFVKTSSWSTGYEGKFTITNNTSTTITSWNVQFDLPSGTTMGTFWDALVTTSGQHVTATNREYNGTLGPNATASFGFVAGGTGSPTNCTVNGSSCGGGGPSVPGQPGAPSVTSTTTTSISLSWGASSGTVSGYRVFEGSTQRAQVTGTTATIGSLGTCTTHTYTVRAFNAAGESAASAAVTGTTQGCTGVPGAPLNNRVTGTTNSSISLAWNASSGTVSGYRVFEGSTQRAQVTGTSATVSGLGTCTTHTYTVRAFNANGESAGSNAATGTTTGCPSSGAMAAAPYLYLGWGNPPPAQTVMSATGVKWFTMAFILSSGGCNASWDGQRPLTGGVDSQNVAAVRAGGGDIIPSFGGWSGNKLGPNCSTPAALAAAYQSVINAYNLKAIDIDIENTDEFESEAVQDRVLNALKIIRQNNPGIKTIITFGVTTSGPNFWGNRLIDRSRDLAANIDIYTVMPFDFGCSGSMVTCTQSSVNGLRNKLMSTFGWDSATASRRIGISGMNGLSDQSEVTSVAAWQQIKDWAQSQQFARLAFWSVNRDRANGAGVPSNNWDFTRITAQFTG